MFMQHTAKLLLSKQILRVTTHAPALHLRPTSILQEKYRFGGASAVFGTDAALSAPLTKATDDDNEEDNSLPFLKKLGWRPADLVAGPEFNRWPLVPAATLTHMCLGSIYGWSIFSQPLMRANGCVAAASHDWALSDITVTFSLVMGGFIWGAIFSKYLDAWGPRTCCMIGATSLMSGFGLASLAVYNQSLPLLYLGGAVWGLANGWAYVPPVATLLKWFPDRKGFASGMCILGYGGGAIVSAPLFSKLLKFYQEVPEYLGPASDLGLVNDGGRLFADRYGELVEVVVATAADIKVSGYDDLLAGVYVVNSGSTGVAETLGTMGLFYGISMASLAFVFKLPKSSPVTAPNAQVTTFNISLENAMKSPQFWIMYAAFGFSITGSYGILSSGKLMMSESFGNTLHNVVTPAFSAYFVSAMSGANLGGRLFWTNLSDYVAKAKGGDPFFGRRFTYSLMFGISIPAYLSMVWAIHSCAESPSVFPLVVYSTALFTVLANFGGTAALRPAMIGDLYGLKHVGVLAARQLSVVLPAAFAGPRLVTYFRESAVHDAIHDLSTKIDDTQFNAAFGASKDQLDTLIEKKTVTVTRLMEMAPAGTQDPTPFVYDHSMYVMASLMGLAYVSNLLLRPLSPKLHEPPKKPKTPVN